MLVPCAESTHLLQFCADGHCRDHCLLAAGRFGAVEPVPLISPYDTPRLPPLLQPDQRLGLSDLSVNLLQSVGEDEPRRPCDILHLWSGAPRSPVSEQRAQACTPKEDCAWCLRMRWRAP